MDRRQRLPAPPDPFAPARLGPLTLRNRVIKSATFEGVTPDGLVTDELIAYHRRPAAGGVAMTTVAYCAVAPEGRTERRQIWMRPEAVPGLRRLTDAVHREGAAVSAQLGHAGPVADARSNRLPALAPGRFLSPLGMRMTGAASTTAPGSPSASPAPFGTRWATRSRSPPNSTWTTGCRAASGSTRASG